MIVLNPDNKITKLIKELQKLIKGSIFENHIFIVGGTIRDIILNRSNSINDIDIAVDLVNGGIAFAEFIAKEYGCYKINSNPCIFPKYGTAKVNIKTIYDLSEFNIECVQTKRKHFHDGSFEFGNVEEDAKKRDLTINSLFYNVSTEELLDPTNKGLNDIKNNIIRTPSDPKIIFEEDPLRMIRVIRFSSMMNWGIDKKTWFGIIENLNLIDKVPQERITEELNKILLLDKPSIGLNKLKNTGLLSMVLPKVFKLVNLEQGEKHSDDAFVHTLKVIDLSKKSKINRWAALLHDIGKPKVKTCINDNIHFYNHESEGAKIALNLLKRMRFSNSDIKQIIFAIKNHMRFKSFGDKCPTDKAIRRFIQDVGKDNVNIVLDVINADNLSCKEEFCYPKQVELIKNRIKTIEEKNKMINLSSPVNGKDIMDKFNLKESPIIGEYLKIINNYLLDHPTANKEECLSHLEKYLVY